MKKILSILLLLGLFCSPALHADEGMWLVNLLDQNTRNQMKSRGFTLNPKEIYNEKDPSLHDAVVSLDFGCSGSMISDKGLMITNHHCAYGDIQAYSTDDKNYLEHGFWAKNQAEEIPIAGKSVFFLRKVYDVSDEVEQYMDSSAKAGRPITSMGMRRVISHFERKYGEGTGYEAMCMSMWRGVKYYVFLYEQFKDVRLVGAPPVSIAAFGGETDNWSWPQHKGDFTLYRVYGDKNGKPAEYSTDNVPIKPVRYLTISEKGIQEKDYAMTMGYPYHTYRYIPSYGAYEKMTLENPAKHSVKRAILDAIKPWMDSDSTIRLKYANRYFGMSNGQELAQGEMKCLARFDVVGTKTAEEAELQKWIDADPQRKTEWGNLLSDLQKSYGQTADIVRAKYYFRESIVSGSLFLLLSNRYKGMVSSVGRRNDKTILTPDSTDIINLLRYGGNSYKDYDEKVEREVLPVVLKYYVQNVPQRFWGSDLKELMEQFKGDVRALSTYVFDNSIFRNEQSFREAFSQPIAYDAYANDPALRLNKSSSILPFNKEEDEALGGLDQAALRTQYAKALYAFRASKNQAQAPDANMTMRLSYGTVGGIKPSDGISLAAQTTIQGYLDKADLYDYEFKVSPKMQQLIANKDWGRWSQNGTLYVNFLSNTDITGGNSGSPVINGKGELIGLAFDGNWESLASDIQYVEGFNKTVNVDIRFVMWVIEKYGEAGYLLQEMKFSK